MTGGMGASPNQIACCDWWNWVKREGGNDFLYIPISYSCFRCCPDGWRAKNTDSTHPPLPPSPFRRDHSGGLGCDGGRHGGMPVKLPPSKGLGRWVMCGVDRCCLVVTIDRDRSPPRLFELCAAPPGV